MPWVEEEDQLLKEKLQGLVVTDGKAPSGRGVKVWFRYPEQEVREQDYPFITIDLLGVAEAFDRAQRGGQVRPTVNGYRPPEYTGPPEERIHVSDWPVAMNLTYQVTTYARHIQHDRQLLRQLWALFPGRYGNLGGNAAPYVRPFSAQLLNMTPGHRLDEFGKRQFRNIFTLQVFSELWASPIKARPEVSNVEITDVIDIPASEWFTDITCYEDD